MATEKKSEAFQKHADSGIISLLFMSSESALKVLFKYLVSPILLIYSVFLIYWMSVYLLIRLSSVAVLFVLSPSSLVDFISDYHHYKKEEANSDSELSNMDQALEYTGNSLIRSPTGSQGPLTLAQRICDLAILLFRSLKQQEKVLAIGDRIEESLYVLEKGEYVFDRYVGQYVRYVIKKTRPSEEEVYKFKGVALSRSEGFIHYIKCAKKTSTLHARPASVTSDENCIKIKQFPVVNEPTSLPTKDIHSYRVTLAECDQLVYQEGTSGDTVLYLTSDEIKGMEYDQKVLNKNCQDESFMSSRFEPPRFIHRPSTNGFVLENRSKDLSSSEASNPSSSNSSSSGSDFLRNDRPSGNTCVSSPPVLSQSMKHKIESYLDKYKENLNTNKPLQVRTRGLSSSEQVKLINIELPNKERSTLKLSITPKKPKKKRIQNENNPFLLRKIKKSLSIEDPSYLEEAKDNIKKVTEI